MFTFDEVRPLNLKNLYGPNKSLRKQTENWVNLWGIVLTELLIIFDVCVANVLRMAM